MPAGEQLTVVFQGPIDPNADFYQLRYDDNPGMTSPVTTSQFLSLSRTFTQLDPTKTWYFEPRAGNDAGTSDWGTQESETPLFLEAPLTGTFSNVLTASFTFNWSAVANAQSYRVQKGVDPTFAVVESDVNVPSGLAVSFTGVPDTDYYCRVAPVGVAQGAWSEGFLVHTIPVSVPDITPASTMTPAASGWEPFGILIDYTATTSTTTTKPFHELDYRTDFGDGAAAESFDYGEHVDKNIGFGPVVGHVFKTAIATPFDIGAEFRAKDGTLASEPAIESVTDILTQDSVYTGTSTTLISRVGGGVFGQYTGTGSPVQITTTNWATVKSAVDGFSGNRVLFAANETWPSVPSGLFPGDTCVLGRFGTGTDPRFFMSSAATDPFITLDDNTGTKLQGLQAFGTSTVPSFPATGPLNGLLLSGTTSDVVVLGCTFGNFREHGIAAGFAQQAGASDQVTDVFVHECDLRDNREGSIVAAMKRWSVQGNILDGSFTTTMATFQAAQQSCIQNNRFTGGVDDSSSNSVHVLAVHAPDFAGESAAGSGLWAAAGQYTESLVVSDNEIENQGVTSGAGGVRYPVYVANQSGVDQRIRNVLFVRNHLKPSQGPASNDALGSSLWLGGTDITALANIVEHSGGNPGSGDAGIYVGTASGGINADSVFVGHNSIYRNGFSAENAIRLGTPSANCTATANLIFFPSGGTAVVVDGTGNAATINSSDAQMLGSPGWSLLAPLVQTSFIPTVGFYGENGGAPLVDSGRVYRRIDGTLFATVGPDLGAWNSAILNPDDPALVDLALVYDELPEV